MAPKNIQKAARIVIPALILLTVIFLIEPSVALYIIVAVPLIALPAYMLAKRLKWPR